MMRPTSNSNSPNTTPEGNSVEIFDAVCDRTIASAQTADVASEHLRPSEGESVINAESSSECPSTCTQSNPEEKTMKTQLPLMRTPLGNVYRSILLLNMLLIVGVISAAPVAAQVVNPTKFIDWDLPSLEGATPCPSAVGAVTLRPPTNEPVDPVYYATRCAGPSANPNNNDPLTGLPRFGPAVVELRVEMHPQPAMWRAWNLGDIPVNGIPGAEDDGPTGGMRLSATGRAFVRTSTQLIRLDLTRPNGQSAPLTRFNDIAINNDPSSTSDLAIVDRGTTTDVWSTHVAMMDPNRPAGVVQRLTIANNSNTATVTRWAVNGGAGFSYLSGIAVFQGKVYFVEGEPFTDVNGRGNSIGVLDPNTNTVWHFSLSDPQLTAQAGPVSGPRQLSIDSTGTAYVITASGHVVSLRANCNLNTAEMAAYLIPGAALGTPGPVSGPRGVSAASGVVGFTESEGKAVGVLLPNKDRVTVTAAKETNVPRATSTLPADPVEYVYPDTGFVQGIEKEEASVSTDMDPFGKFIEALLPDTGNFPLGILRDPFSAAGNFYVAVQLGGVNVGGPDHRLTRVEFPMSTSTAGLATGGGTIDPTPDAPEILGLDPDPDVWANDGGDSNFGFVCYRSWWSGTPRGQLVYHNKTTDERVKSTSITSFTVTGKTARITGTCSKKQTVFGIELDSPCSFDVTVTDNGSPGKGRDTFSISGSGLTTNSGTLNGGNIWVHKGW